MAEGMIIVLDVDMSKIISMDDGEGTSEEAQLSGILYPGQNGECKLRRF